MRMTTKTKTSSKQRWTSPLLSFLLWGLPLSSEPKWLHQEAPYFHGDNCPHPMFLLPKLHCRRREPTTLFPKRLLLRSSPASTPLLTAIIYPRLETSLLRTASTKISFSHLPSLAERWVYIFFLLFKKKRHLKIMLIDQTIIRKKSSWSTMTGNSRVFRKVHWCDKYGHAVCDRWHFERGLLSCWSFMAFRWASTIQILTVEKFIMFLNSVVVRI